MKSRSSAFLGIILICFGSIILLKDVFYFDLNFVRGFGLFIVGLLGFLWGLQQSPRRGMFFFSFLIAIGIFFGIEELGLYYFTPRMTVSAMFICFGIAFYPLYFLGASKWTHMLYGNIFLLAGIFFLSYYLRIISYDIFATVVYDYSPVILIIIGVAYLINAIQNSSKKMNSSAS